PNARFHFPKCASLRSRRAGKTSLTKNFDSRGRRFGWSDCPELLLKVLSRRELMDRTIKHRNFLPLLKPDPNFYPSPRLAIEPPSDKYAFVAALNPPGSR